MSSAEFALSSHVASQLECAICIGKLVQPKLLTCGHTFCRGCLEELVEPESFYAPAINDNDPSIVCPLCRNETQVPSEGVDGLTTNFALQSLVESLNLTTGELEEPGDEEEEESTPKSGEVEDGELTMCELHKEKMKFYCSTCELLICRDCTVVDHPRPDHKCTNLDEAYTWRQQINQKELQLAKGLIKLTKKSRGALLATVENLNERCDQVINEIEACRQEGMEMLNSNDALIEEYQCSLEEHTQHLRNLTQHAKGTTKIDVLDQSKSLVETLSSCRDKRHVILDTPSKVQYPMFVGAEEEIQGWPRPSGPRKGHAKSKNKKISQDKTSETETNSMEHPNLALGSVKKGNPQAIYPPLPQMYLQQSSVPGGGVFCKPQRGARGGRGYRGYKGGQVHRGGQGHRDEGQGQKRGGGGGGREGRGGENKRGWGGGQGGENQRGRGGGRGGENQRGRGGGRGGENQRGWGGGRGGENQRGRGGQTGN